MNGERNQEGDGVKSSGLFNAYVSPPPPFPEAVEWENTQKEGRGRRKRIHDVGHRERCHRGV